MKAHEYEHLREQIVFWKLRLAEEQRKHIQDLFVDVNNVDTWEKYLNESAKQLAFIWREIKLLQEMLKGEN